MSERRRRLALRVALAALGLTTVQIGLVATLEPRRFYDEFPFVASWVDRLPPYNEHLVTDVGGLYLAFTVLFAWAAVTLRPALTVPVCAAFAPAVVLHLVFHVTHLDGFPAADALGQTGVLTAQLALALGALALARRVGDPPDRPAGEPPDAARVARLDR